MSQILVNDGFLPVFDSKTPGIILINTCSVTKKGELESLGKVRHLRQQYPDSLIIVTGCADLKKVSQLKNVFTYDNSQKEKLLSDLKCAYSPKIKDKFSHTHRYLLKVQSGCTQFCTYCTVPHRRQYLWSLSVKDAISTVNKAVSQGYKEIIITGVNLDQYQPGLTNLVKTILDQTKIPLVTFGSVPVNSISPDFINLFNSDLNNRLSQFLHIPIQSGSDRILKLMNRPYTQNQIITVLTGLKQANPTLTFGTDIIVGFPSETEADFNETQKLCQTIGFKKIHVFKYSPRPNTVARFYHQKHPKFSKEVLTQRSQKIRSLIK